jgi:hypothetical protein
MIPVLSDDDRGRVVGVVTERDIVCRAVSEGADLRKVPASFCMSYPVVSIAEKSSLGECMRLMRENQIRRIVVVNDDEQCIGIVSQVDLYKASNGRGFLFSHGDRGEELQSHNWVRHYYQWLLRGEVMPRKGRIREKDTHTGYELQEGRETPSGFVPDGYERPPQALDSCIQNGEEEGESLTTHMIKRNGSQHFADPDEALEHLFREQIENDTTVDGSQVVVSAVDGVLHLTGLVLSEESRELIEQMASNLKGVRKVESVLQIRSMASRRYRSVNSQASGMRGVKATISNERRHK